jgi:hypothetical protein
MPTPNGLNPVFDTVSGKRPVISGSGATRSLSTEESGSLVLMDRAAGIVFTLPTQRPGTYYDFMVTTTVTSNSYKVITGAGTELLIGSLTNIDTDTSNAVAAWTANGSTHIAVTMNGTTTGGVAGTYFRLTCLSATRWLLSGTIQGTGVVATPLATS